MKHTLKLILSFVLALPLLFSACSQYDEIQEEIAQLKETVSKLEAAYSSGKIISSVTANESDDAWLIVFSDSTSIQVANGVDGHDGVTPFVKVNEEGCWCVSYDGGHTFELLLDKNGNSIAAGKDGSSIRVSTNDKGYYVIEIYDSVSDVVIDSIVTSYSSNPNGNIQSIVENASNKTISITLASGEVFTFKQMVIYPSSIILFQKELSIKNGGCGTIEFRVNPSNAEFDVKDVQLDLEQPMTKSQVSYVTIPESYSIQSVEQSKDAEGNLKRGQYVLTVKDNQINPEYCDNVAIVIVTTDSQGNLMELSSELITVSSKFPSQLPRVYITTPDRVDITSKTEWLKKSTIKVIDESGNVDLDVTTSIRGRGNTTWNNPKKPYAIKLDSKAEVLGMPKHKRWVLLANYMDRTLLRNDVALEIARRIMEWAPRGKFVEVYLNGKHLGNYYLCEQIKVDKNRVNVEELDEETDFNDQSQITGGYILEFDTYGPNDEINYFYSQLKKYPVTIKEPDEEVITSWEHPAYLYIEGYVNRVEQLLKDDQTDRVRWEEVTELLDITSYIDWWLVHELTGNAEPNHPKSSYMYKKRDGKLYAGPVWDFDWGTFRAYSSTLLTSALWYGDLFKYSEFRNAVKERWSELQNTLSLIDEYIDSQSKLIEESNNANIVMWPLTGNANADEKLSFDDAIATMRAAYKHRLEVIGKYISNL